MSTEKQTGVDLIAAERDRQINAEGWSPEHDDQYIDHQLVAAAISYANFAASHDSFRDSVRRDPRQTGLIWPWGPGWWKPGKDNTNESRIRELVKAGALIATEIDRLKRSRG